MNPSDNLIKELCREVRGLTKVLLEQNRLVMTTAEACEFLQISEGRTLTEFYRQGILTHRYGAQGSGFKWSKKEIVTLQIKLLSGDVQLPKRQPKNPR